jgi:hypothetical protein
MGGQISKLFSSLIWAKKEIRILILGLVSNPPLLGSDGETTAEAFISMDRTMRERLHFYTD